jgi:hypothetical protein
VIKAEVVGENDYLTPFRLLNNSSGNGDSAVVIQRRHGVIEDDASVAVDAVDVGYEAGQR